jgi:hypothetical protein
MTMVARRYDQCMWLAVHDPRLAGILGGIVVVLAVLIGRALAINAAVKRARARAGKIETPESLAIAEREQLMRTAARSKAPNPPCTCRGHEHEYDPVSGLCFHRTSPVRDARSVGYCTCLHHMDVDPSVVAHSSSNPSPK